MEKPQFSILGLCPPYRILTTPYEPKMGPPHDMGPQPSHFTLENSFYFLQIVDKTNFTNEYFYEPNGTPKKCGTPTFVPPFSLKILSILQDVETIFKKCFGANFREKPPPVAGRQPSYFHFYFMFALKFVQCYWKLKPF